VNSYQTIKTSVTQNGALLIQTGAASSNDVMNASDDEPSRPTASQVLVTLLKKSVSSFVVFSYLSLTVGQSYAMEGVEMRTPSKGSVVPVLFDPDSPTSVTAFAHTGESHNDSNEAVVRTLVSIDTPNNKVPSLPENSVTKKDDEKVRLGLEAAESYYKKLVKIDKEDDENQAELRATKGWAPWFKKTGEHSLLYTKRTACVAKDAVIWTGLTVADGAIWASARAKKMYFADAEMPDQNDYFNANARYYKDQDYLGGRKDDYMHDFLTVLLSGALSLSLVAEIKIGAFTIFDALATKAYFYELFYYDNANNPYYVENNFIAGMKVYATFFLSWFLLYKASTFIDSLRPSQEERVLKEHYNPVVEWTKTGTVFVSALSAGFFAYSQYYLNAYGLKTTTEVTPADLTYLPIFFGASSYTFAWVLKEKIVDDQTRNLMRVCYDDEAKFARERTNEALTSYIEDAVKKLPNKKEIKLAQVSSEIDLEAQLSIRTAEDVEQELSTLTLTKFLRKIFIEGEFIKVGDLKEERRHGLLNNKGKSRVVPHGNAVLPIMSESDAVEQGQAVQKESGDGTILANTNGEDTVHKEKDEAKEVKSAKALQKELLALQAQKDNQSICSQLLEIACQTANSAGKVLLWGIKNPKWLVAAGLSVPVLYLAGGAFEANAQVSFVTNLSDISSITLQKQYTLQFDILEEHTPAIEADPTAWLKQCLNPNDLDVISNKTVIPHTDIISDEHTISTAALAQEFEKYKGRSALLNTTRGMRTLSAEWMDFIDTVKDSDMPNTRMLSNTTDTYGATVDDDAAYYYFQENGYFPAYIVQFHTKKCLGIAPFDTWISGPKGFVINNDTANMWYNEYLDGYAYYGEVPISANNYTVAPTPELKISLFGKKIVKSLSIPYAIGAFGMATTGTADTFDQICNIGMTSASIADVGILSFNFIQGLGTAAPFIVATYLSVAGMKDQPWMWTILSMTALTSALGYLPAYRKAFKKMWRQTLNAVLGRNARENLLEKLYDLRDASNAMDPSILNAVYQASIKNI
jgi:hypothetical protein